MEHLIYPIVVGIIVSLIVFLFFERRGIQARRKSKVSGFHPENPTIPESFILYQTGKNVTYYIISMFIFTVFLSYFGFFTDHLTLIDVFLYIFLTTFLGSLIIFILKIRRSILIKVFAAFLYGAPLIFSSALGFIFTYIIYREFIQ